jgi:hypothetical protein
MKDKKFSINDLMSPTGIIDEVAPTTSGLTQKDLIREYNAKRAAELKKMNSAQTARFKKLRKFAGLPVKGLAAALGPIAGIGTALMTGDASAALPEALRSDPLGPAPGSLSAKLESGERLTPEEIEQFKREMEENIK